MPQIIVIADDGTDELAVLLRERITSSDFESETFAARLVERLGWAIDDAHAVEQARPEEPRSGEPTAGEPTTAEPTTGELTTAEAAVSELARR
jgi:hypothetical protein